jgi:hypothetical protein
MPVSQKDRVPKRKVFAALKIFRTFNIGLRSLQV